MSGNDARLTYVDRAKPDPFIMSPRDMIEYDETRPLSPTARLVRMYLHDLSRRPGWTIYVAQVQRALGLSPGAWVRARRELEAAGYYRAQRTQAPGSGKWEWWHFVYRDPHELPSAAKKTIPPNSMDGSSIHGFTADKRTTTLRSTTTRSSITQTHDSAASAAANDRRRAKPQPKVWQVRPSGIVCWYPDDHASAEIIEATTPPDVLAATVVAIRAVGKDPVPGLVMREGQRARAMRDKAEKAKAREASGPLAEARKRRAERERREADPVARQAGLDAARKVAAKLGM
ncbi:MAG: hypothetical protein ACTHOA_12710 [Rhodanobacter sp.]